MHGITLRAFAKRLFQRPVRGGHFRRGFGYGGLYAYGGDWWPYDDYDYGYCSWPYTDYNSCYSYGW